MKLLPKLQIVLMDCPYDTWHYPQTRDLFGKLVDLKIRGYKAEYPDGVLPVDTTDFVATHHLVCVEKNGSLWPITGFKSITLDRCKRFNLPFSGLGLAKCSGNSAHELAVLEIVKRVEERKAQISYDGSWTIDPEIRKTDRVLTQELRDIFSAVYYLYHHDYGISESFGAGALRFKADRLFATWGYKPLALNGVDLPSFRIPFAKNEEVIMMHINQYSDEAKQLGNKYRALWNDCILITPQNLEPEQRKAG